MELLIIVIMIVLGLGIAAVVAVLAGAVSTAERNREQSRQPPDRDAIAASIVYQIGTAGGAAGDAVLRFLREAHLLAPVTPNVHMASWAEAYRRMSTPQEREALLELAVRAAVAHNAALPLAQYNALLDLSFGLGFQTDALARLRARYRFEYTDYAKHGRPVTADRAGGGAPLFQRPPADPQPLLSILGLAGKVSRHELTSAYRRLAAQNHPDRFYSASPDEQATAASRFIELTEAYEQLLPLCED